MDTVPKGTETNAKITLSGFPRRQIVDGSIDYVGDRDWYAIEMMAGNTYRFSALETPFPLDLRFALHDQNGNLVSRSTFSITHKALFDQTFFIDVGGTAGTRGNFSFEILETVKTVGPLIGNVTGFLTAGRDTYVANVDMRFELIYFGPSGSNLEVRLSDGTFLEIARVGSPTLGRFLVAGDSAGTAYVSVVGESSGNYSLSLRPADIPSGDFDQAREAEPNSSNHGLIEDFIDRDLWKVDLVAGKHYVVGASLISGNTDVDLAMFDESGNLVSINKNGGIRADPLLVFDAANSGPHYFDVRARGETTGSYSFFVFEDVADSRETAETTAWPGSLIGELDYLGDVDYTAFEVEVGQSFVIDAGFHFNSRVPLLRILDGSGVNVFSYASPPGRGVPSSAGSDRIWQAPTGGTYYAEVTGFRQIGAYDFHIYEEQTSNFSTAPAFVPNTTVAGILETATDTDSFSLAAKSGSSYAIQLKGFNAYYRLYDSSNALVYTNLNAQKRHEEYVFGASVDEIFHIQIGGFGRRYSGGDFSLAVRADEDGATLNDPLPIAAERRVRGNIDSDFDHDYYTLELEAGQAYVVKARGAASGLGTLDAVRLRISSDSSDAVDLTNREGDAGGGAKISFIAPTNDAYHIEVSGSGGTGTYALDIVLA